MNRWLICILCLVLPAWALDRGVRVESGLLIGATTASNGVLAFKGIPFATPPTGDLRWRPPQPVKRWPAYRNANRFGPICEQTPNAPGSLFFKGDFETRGEDCLYLNVWTPAKTAAEKLPVMLWLFGGSFTHGSGTESFFDGEAFARKGVVLVTFNYRVGAFGFLAHPELSKESVHGISGNYGLLDQLAALEWVHRNIAAFGGDPGRVTIFGQSAGAASDSYLATSPLAKGLFHRVIGQSGLGAGPPTGLAEAEKRGASFAESLGARSLAELRAVPAEKILAARGTWSRVVDGYYLPGDPLDLLAAGKQNDTPVMVGSVENEGYAAKPITAAAYLDSVRRIYGPLADQFLKVYPVQTDEQADATQFAVARDRLQAIVRLWAQLENKNGKFKTYIYLFTHPPPFPPDVKFPEGPGSRLGAYHSSEVPYVFNTLQSRWGWPWTGYDRKLADMMCSYWVNFAATGDPNGKGLPAWPAYDDVRQPEMVFGETVATEPIPHRAGVDFMAAFAEWQKSGNN